MKIIDSIVSAKCVLIVGHQRPDGDCLGAGFALYHYITAHGGRADFVCDSDKPQHYSFMPYYAELNNVKYKDYDLVVCVDCADSFRLGKYAGYLKRVVNSVNIDHHKTNDSFAKINLIKHDACSTCEIVFGLMSEAGIIDDTSALCLYVGLSTDTGHFMHSNVTPYTFEIASKLVSYDIKATELNRLLYKSNSIQKTKLIARAIESMKFYKDNQICIISVSLKDLSDCGCVQADTEGLIDYGTNIGDCLVAICICETNKGYKVSYRSKSIDVAAAAAVFGGGGHKLAAGCVVSGYYEDVVRKVLKSVTDGME